MSRYICIFALVNALAATSLLPAVTTAAAADWPEFRGPTGQGHAAGPLPTEWSPTKNVAWKVAVPGKGWSSPIVLGERIYLTTAVPEARGGAEDQSLRLLCLKASDGAVVWDREVFRQDGATAAKIHGKNSHASPTPLSDGKRIYVHFGHQGTAAVDLDGKVVWTNRDFRYVPVHGNGGCPVFVDDTLVFSCDGADRQVVVALDRATGKLRWQTDRKTTAGKRFSFCTPLLIELPGPPAKPLIISPGSGLVGGYDPKTGTEVWRFRYGQGYSVVPRPVFGHGLLFICSGYDKPALFAIRPDGTGDVTETHLAWTTNRGVPHNPSLLLVGTELYMVSDNGVASCLDAVKGTVHWQQRIGGNFSASPILADGKIYFTSEDGTTTIVRAATKFETLATNKLGERTLASPAVLGRDLLLRTEKALYRIGSGQ